MKLVENERIKLVENERIKLAEGWKNKISWRMKELHWRRTGARTQWQHPFNIIVTIKNKNGNVFRL